MTHSVNQKVNLRGDTALHFAVYHQDLELIDFLVKRGADIFSKNELGYSPIEMAALYSSKVVI